MCTIWLFNIAMENGPFIDGLPIKNGDFQWLCVNPLLHLIYITGVERIGGWDSSSPIISMWEFFSSSHLYCKGHLRETKI